MAHPSSITDWRPSSWRGAVASTRTGAVQAPLPFLPSTKSSIRGELLPEKGHKSARARPSLDRIWLIEHECTLMTAYFTQSHLKRADASTAAVATVNVSCFEQPQLQLAYLVPRN